MKMDVIWRLHKYIQLIFLLVNLASCLQNRTIDVVLYYEDIQRINTTKINKQINLYNESQNKININTNFHPMQTSLEDMVSSKVTDLIKNSDFVVSFLKGKESRILHEVLRQKIVHLSLNTEDCHLGYGSDKKSYDQCHTFTVEHQKAILIMSSHIHGMKVAIMTTKSSCSHSFSTNLLEEFLKQNKALALSEKINVTLFEFSEDLLNMKDISSLMYSIKFFNPSLIILICEQTIQEIVLQAASKHSMLGYGEIWLIPEFAKTISKKLIPVQLVNIERTVEGKNISLVTQEQIVKALKVANEIVREPRLLEQPSFLSSIPCGSSSYSTVNISVKTGNRSDWVPVYTKTGSSGYQFQPNSGLAMSLFASKKPSVRFRVVTIFDPPFTMDAPYLGHGNARFWQCEEGLPCREAIKTNDTGNTTGSTQWRKTCCIGHSIELLQLLMKRINFGVDIYIVEDGFYGSKVNGVFNGLIGDVARNKADFAIAGLTMTALRSSVVDFTSPFIRQDIGIVTMSTKTKLEFINWQFAVPIETNVIVAIFVGIILGTFLVYVLENQELVMKRLLDPKLYPPKYACREGFTYYSGLTFQRDLGGKNPTKLGSRVVAVVFAFAMLVVMTTYTAVLTATKVTQEGTKPFLGVKDERMLNPTEDFKFATVPSTSIEGFFKDAPDENFRRMYVFMKKYNVKSVAEGLEKVKSGELQAFIHEYPFLLYFLSKQSTCSLKITGQPIGQSGFGLAMPKKSAWTDRFSYEILRLKEQGALVDLDKKWLASGCSEQSSTLLTPEAFSLEYFGGLVLTIGIAFLAMFLMLPLEYAYQKYHRIPLNALVNRILGWRESRKQKLSVRSRPTLKSVSSESNFVELSSRMSLS